MTAANLFRPTCESLDERLAPAVALVGGTLTIVGTTGNDVIRVTLASGKIQATVVNTAETFTFEVSQVTGIDIGCGLGDDSVAVGQAITVAATIRGGAGNDSLTGGGGGDFIKGGLGNDSINGRLGNDTLQAGAGNDSLGGGGGIDTLVGGDGDDVLRGGDGDDSINGGGGNDAADGGAGTDTVTGAFDPDSELEVNLIGVTGQGTASFDFGPGGSGTERVVSAGVTGLSPLTPYSVFVEDTPVGIFTTDANGAAGLTQTVDFDPDGNGVIDFPPNLPEISAGVDVSVRTITGTVVLQGTFVASV